MWYVTTSIIIKTYFILDVQFVPGFSRMLFSHICVHVQALHRGGAPTEKGWGCSSRTLRGTEILLRVH